MIHSECFYRNKKMQSNQHVMAFSSVPRKTKIGHLILVHNFSVLTNIQNSFTVGLF